MRYEQVKKPSDIVLAGITPEIDYNGGSATRLLLTDEAGHKVLVTINYGSLIISTPEKPKVEKRYKVTGKVGGFQFESSATFEYRSEALDAVERFRGVDDTALAVLEVEVPVE